MVRTTAALFCVAASLPAAEIVLPSTALERAGSVPVTYRTNSQATGKGELTFRWTDVHGRVIEDRKIPVALNDESEISFTIDLRRAAAMKNELSAHFSFQGINKAKRPDRREEDAKIVFIAKPPERKWSDYAIMMWQNYRGADFAKLKTLGINGGQYGGKSRTPPDFLLDNDLRWYSENIATDFYSEYHRWKPDRPTNAQFVWIRELYKKDPASKEAFKRQPSLSDPTWRQKIRDRLIDSVKFYSPYRPLFYSLGDETGIADLAAYWDFDFSDFALAEMRRWLKQRYGTLADLNRQWGTRFEAWDLVTPDTTNEAMKREGENFSSWADHKEFMDLSFAGALKMGNDAVKSADPDALAGIGGAQMPGWGGYDYYRITQSLTAIEPYDIGANVEIIRSLNPSLAVITTAFAHGPWEKHRVWYELLHGGRGLIIWDDKNEFVGKDGTIGARGEETAAYYRELRGGLGALFVNSRRTADPVAIHYSQASMRTEWMLAQRPKGDAWASRGSSRERMDSEFLRLRESWCRLIEDAGLQYNFVAYGQVEDGELLRRGYRVLILPRSRALSEAEAREIRVFAAQGGTVIADGEPGVFDEHSRRLPAPRLADIADRFVRVKLDTVNYLQHRLMGKEGETLAWFDGLMKQKGVRPAFAVMDAAGKPAVGIETHVFRDGAVSLVALHSNPQFRVNELGPPEFKSNERFEKPAAVKLRLPGTMNVIDVRAGKPEGRTAEISATVDPYEPRVFAISSEPLPDFQLSTAASAVLGSNVIIAVRSAAPTPAAVHVYRIDVAAPDGKALPCYSGNVIAPSGRAARVLPLALNDPAGAWEIRATDILTGRTHAVKVEVR